MSHYEYIPNVISNHDEWFAALQAELAWVHRDNAPRREYWTNTFDRPYTYGNGLGRRTYDAQPDHRLISLARVGIVLGRTDCYLEGCFANLYEGSRDSLGWHADDDPGIDHTKPIAVITLGQGRNIQFRKIEAAPSDANPKGIYGEPETIMLEGGSLLLMMPGCQSTHQHRIPKASFVAKPRISLTYRGLLETVPAPIAEGVAA